MQKLSSKNSYGWCLARAKGAHKITSMAYRRLENSIQINSLGVNDVSSLASLMGKRRIYAG